MLVRSLPVACAFVLVLWLFSLCSCSFGVATCCPQCSYDHPTEARPSNSGTGGLPPGSAAPPGRSTNAHPQSVQHGQGPRPSPQQQPNHQQQSYAHQPQPLQRAQASQPQQQLGYLNQLQYQHPPYEQPQAVTQVSLGQQRAPLASTPGSSAPAGGCSTGGGYVGSSNANAYGGGGSNSSTTTPSAPVSTQPLRAQLGSRRSPFSTALSSAEPQASAPSNRSPDSFEAPSASVGPTAPGAPGSNPETSRSQGLQQGSAMTHTPTTPAASATIPLAQGTAGISTAASTGGWVYDYTTGGYKIAPPPSAPVNLAEPASVAVAPGTSVAPVPSYQQQQQQAGIAYGTLSTHYHSGPYDGGQALSSAGGANNSVTVRHGQQGAAPGVAAPSDAHPTLPACAPTYSAQQQQPQPSTPSTASVGAPSPSTYDSTGGQYSVYSGVPSKSRSQPGAGPSAGGSTASVSVESGRPSCAVATTNECGLQGTPSVYAVPPRALPQQTHGGSNQTPSLQYGNANVPEGSGATLSSRGAHEGIGTQKGSSSYGGVSATDTPQPGYASAPTTTPETIAEGYAATVSTGSARSSQYRACGALPSYGGQTSASPTSGGQQVSSKYTLKTERCRHAIVGCYLRSHRRALRDELTLACGATPPLPPNGRVLFVCSPLLRCRSRHPCALIKPAVPQSPLRQTATALPRVPPTSL